MAPRRSGSLRKWFVPPLIAAFLFAPFPMATIGMGWLFTSMLQPLPELGPTGFVVDPEHDDDELGPVVLASVFRAERDCHGTSARHGRHRSHPTCTTHQERIRTVGGPLLHLHEADGAIHPWSVRPLAYQAEDDGAGDLTVVALHTGDEVTLVPSPEDGYAVWFGNPDEIRARHARVANALRGLAAVVGAVGAVVYVVLVGGAALFGRVWARAGEDQGEVLAPE